MQLRLHNLTNGTSYSRGASDILAEIQPDAPSVGTEGAYSTHIQTDRMGTLRPNYTDYTTLPDLNRQTITTDLPWDYLWSTNWTDSFNTTEESLINVPINPVHAVLVGFVLGITILFVIGGNVLVLLAVFVNSHLRSTTNYFIVNLAMADLLLGTCVLPFSASLEVINYWAFGPTFCDIWAAVDVLCCTASILSLCVISIDRYIGVTKPLQHSSIMTEKRAVGIIIFVWLLSATISVAPLIGWKEPPGPDPLVCEVTQQQGYVLFSVSVSFYIPLFIILGVYCRIYKEASTQSRFLQTGIKTSKSSETNQEVTLRIHTGRATPNTTGTKNPTYQSSSSSEHSEGSGKKNSSRMTLAGKVAKFKREKKAAKTLGIVVGVFIVCWFPFFFILPLTALCPTCYVPPLLFKIIFWLGYLNSVMNPIIYACSSREFKRAFSRILRCQFRRRKRSFMTESTTSGNEISRLVRLTTIRRTASRRRTKSCRVNDSKKRSSRNSNLTGSTKSASAKLFLEPCSKRNRSDTDSPIASLRLLQSARKSQNSDVLLSDEESNISDDERSDFSAEITSSPANHVPPRKVPTTLDLNCKTPDCSRYHVGNGKCSLPGQLPPETSLSDDFGSSLRNQHVPDIVIHDINENSGEKTNPPANNTIAHALVHTGNSNSDKTQESNRILWL